MNIDLEEDYDGPSIFDNKVEEFKDSSYKDPPSFDEEIEEFVNLGNHNYDGFPDL